MKQFQFDYNSISSLKKDLEKIKLWRKAKVYSAVVFQIYSDALDRGQIEVVCEIISHVFPDALIMGCSTNGNIIEGRLSTASISVVCTVLEFPSTKVKLLQYTLTEETALDVVSELKKILAQSPWVKAVEMQMTIRGMSMTSFCEAFTGLKSDIQVYGGGAFNPNVNSNDACVFSNVGGFSEKGVVFLLIGGEDIFVDVSHITGWKPLGKEFLVTRAKNAILYELDGKPAYEAYFRYLNIANDAHFFNNTLEFPFFYQHHGISILRAPIASNEDGSLTMTSDIDENVKAKIAYGDPRTILHSVRMHGQEIRKFKPEIIKIFSCAGRRTYWGKTDISKETLPFQTIAPTSGFYTSSEFMRNGEYVNQHNVTLVVAALREGEGNENVDFDMEEDSFSGKVSMINRLATFIDAATQELMHANELLFISAVTDSLTQLFNRGEIQRRIYKCLKEEDKTSCLIMLDIDNFKQINDTYGHDEGDLVITELARTMRDAIDEFWHTETIMPTRESLESVISPIGRWGGEEFMILVPGHTKETAFEIAEQIRKKFNSIKFPKAGNRSVSIGITEICKGEDVDAAYVRVDKALYNAKESGKNRIATL